MSTFLAVAAYVLLSRAVICLFAGYFGAYQPTWEGVRDAMIDDDYPLIMVLLLVEVLLIMVAVVFGAIAIAYLPIKLGAWLSDRNLEIELEELPDNRRT